MEDHTKMSWKKESVITQLHNSVDNVTLAVEKALSHPTEHSILVAEEKIEHANRSVSNAIEKQGDSEPIRTLQAQLNQDKERLNRIH